MSELLTGRQFAELLGRAPSYIPKLKSLGVLNRCYVEVEGRKEPLINPEIAIEEIEASKDPSKEHIREMWNAHRTAVKEGAGAGADKSEQQTECAAADNTEANEKPGNEKAANAATVSMANEEGAVQNESEHITPERKADEDLAGDGASQARLDEGDDKKSQKLTFADVKTQREHVNFQRDLANLKKEAGELIDGKKAHSTVFSLLRTLRDSLATIPDRQADVLAATTDPVRTHEILETEINKTLEDVTRGLQQRLIAGTDTGR